MYMAPELINLKKYKGEEIDLFALGVILFTLITGFYPFNKVGPIYNPKIFSILG